MPASKTFHSRESIAKEIATPYPLAVKELKNRWRQLYGSEPPHGVSRELLTRAIAYRIQEQAFGGLKPATRKLLERLATDAAEGRPLRLGPAAPAPAGTVLMREWQGTTHEVKVLDNAVLYKPPRYPSLSECAVLVNAVRWV